MPDGKKTSEKMRELKSNSVKHGWLIKEGGKNKSYKVRYVVAVPGELYYWEKESSLEPNGVLELTGSTCVFEGSAKNGKRTFYQFTLNVKASNAAKKKKKDNHGGIYRFLADDKDLAESWVAAINKCK
eukprot:SAG31_NODE_345_length_17358_cov_61.906889_7_plen_128_part_00